METCLGGEREVRRYAVERQRGKRMETVSAQKVEYLT